MQAGFICYEVGFVQSKNVIFVAIENLLTFMITTIGFCLFGFPLMFGKTFHGFIGNGFWFFKGISEASPLGYAFVFFQLMFAATAVTIFAGSMSERAKLLPLQIAAFISTVIIFPVYGHWVWGGLFLNQNTWLSHLGFIDFAGATVVHTTAGFISLAGSIVVGKRIKMKNGKSNIPFAVLGVFILWFAWFGFNVGGALTGAVAGLATITPAAGYIEPWAAAIIGLLAGFVCYYTVQLRIKLDWDDALDVWGVHGVGGILGSVLVGVFAVKSINGIGGLINGDVHQFLIQILGVAIISAYAFIVTFIILKIVNKFVPVRVSEYEEERGLDISIHHEEAYR